jgi:sugar (pentulose or hexulose) kinase
LQQCRAAWKEQGHDYDYAELVRIATDAPALTSFIDAGDARFLPQGDHPSLIQDYCRTTRQPVPSSHGAIVRCVLESFALKYRQALETLCDLTNRSLSSVQIVGGGSQNVLLNQLTADATGKHITAGPVEATVLGNALVQLIALGEIKDIREGRQAVASMAEMKQYEPHQTNEWAQAYERYRSL